MESELLKEWTAEEREEAAERATINTSLSIILRLLDEKFEIVPKSIKDKLQEIKDPEVLQYLSAKVIKAETLEEFQQYIEKAVK